MLKEYYDSTEDSEQHSIETINKNILDLFEFQPDSSEFYSDIVDDIDSKDVERYIYSLEAKQNIKTEKIEKKKDKEFTFKHIPIKDEETFAQLCDYSDIKYSKEIPFSNQKIYIIESHDYAVSIIPIQLDNKFLNIRISPLKDSPEFIMDLYNKKRKMELKDIKFVKLK